MSTSESVVKKHRNFILAVDKDEFLKIFAPDGTSQTMPDFLKLEEFGEDRIEAMCQHVLLKQRRQLENDPRYLQIIPYVSIRRLDSQGDEAQILIYGRTNKVGESRLVGNTSLGLGGHVELMDLEYPNNGEIDLEKTIKNSITRELIEETSGLNVLENNDYRLRGIIYDPSNAVGRVHVGFVYDLVIAHDCNLKVSEEELVDYGFFNLDDFLFPDSRISVSSDLAQHMSKLESWSVIFANHLQDVEGAGKNYSPFFNELMKRP